MKKRLPFGFLTLFVLLFSFKPSAQSLYEVSLDEKVQSSSLIIEGKVIGSESFWNSRHTMIYTSNKVEIYKIFKGSTDNNIIEIITQGGQLDNVSIQASDLITLKKEEVGIFFCYPNKSSLRSPSTNNVLFDVYSSSQGFFKYDPVTLTANAPFANFRNIETDLYNVLEKKTGSSYRSIKSFSSSSLRHSNAASRTLAISITSFSPATVNAGATRDPSTNVLTITGTGFGTASGSAAVIFDDPDDGSGGNLTMVPFDDPLIISWSATSIQLRVPTNAGTGSFMVEDDLGNIATSPSNLVVNYAILTGNFPFAGVSVTKEANLMNTNGAGGYTVRYSTSVAGSGVDLNAATLQKSAFQRAFTTWKELTGFNIVEGATTTNQVLADDGNNTIMFDNTNTGQPPLASGVLGVCYFFANMCTPIATREPQRTGFDIVIRNNAVSVGSTNFTSGPCPPASSSFTDVDLETVLLHELGHAIGLGHVIDGKQGTFLPNINPGKLMNFSLVNGVRRSTPDQSAYNGAIYLTTAQGNSYGSCGLFSSEMTALTKTTESKDECPVFPTTPLANNTVVAFDLVHATSNKFSDPQFTALNCSGTGTGVTNTAFYALKTSGGGSLILNVSGYGTTPAALSSCTPTGSYPAAAGVELAIYAVSSCPTGQAFPAPIACRTFNANGVLASVSGLSAGSTYLLVADGIENTKASFSLTFGGSVLPIKFENFSGEEVHESNQLKWVIESSLDVKKLSLEKSGDGTNFTAIKDIDAINLLNKDGFTDSRPFIGNNYYRLVIENSDGSKQYSNIVLLVRKERILISMYPNPAKSVINLEVNTLEKGNYVFDLYNNMGQLVLHQGQSIASNGQLIALPVPGLARGSYFLKISNSKSELIKNLPVQIH